MAHELKVPSVGESIAEVYIGRWHKKVGDPVQEGDVLVELESDKAMVELPAPHGGVLTQILKAEGDEAEVGEVIALLDVGGQAAAAPAPAASAAGSTPQPEAPAAAGPAAAPAAEGETPAGPAPGGDGVVVMPAAQRLLDRHGLDAAGIRATGFGGRLLKEDVERHLAAGGGVGATPGQTPTPPTPTAPPATAAAPAVGSPPRPAAPAADGAARPERVVRMSPIRRRIASRLVEAQRQAALLTTFNEIDMTRVMNLRRAHQEKFTETHDARLGFMSFFVKAAVAALQRIPEVNAEIRDDSIVYKDYYDIGIAVGGGRGLVVPVLRDADRLGFADIEKRIADFARRAQDNTLTVDELQGGTFTISNGGVYGSLLSTPIVNPPQSGILGLHRIQARPVAVDGEVVIRNMMYVALTYDHRIVDGREAVTFLVHIKELLEDPERMLLEV